jgi:hypothetical protein
MTRPVIHLFALVVAVVVASTGRECLAHFPWLTTNDEGHALLFFSESPAERDYHLPECVAQAEVMLLGGDEAKTLKLAEVDEDNYIGRRSESEVPAGAALATSCRYGVYHGTLLTYYAKYLPVFDHNHAQAERPMLDADLQQTDDGLEATVYWEGKPVAGAIATLIGPDGETQEEETDDNGTITFKTPDKGLVGLVVGYILEDAAGTFRDEPYQSESHYATFSFRQGKEKAVEPEKDLQSSLPPLPEGVASFGAAVCDGWLYVYGGHIGTEHDHSRENLSRHFRRIRLDGQGDWEELPMEAPLQGLPLVSVGGKLYRIGGLDARDAPDEDDDLYSVANFHSFDPANNKWQALPPLPEPRSSHDAVAIGSKIYVVGGWTLDGPGDGQWLDTAWVYDTSQTPGQWKPLPSPPFRRRALAAAAWNGKLVALGGMDDDAIVSERVDAFDPASGKWTQLADFPGGDMAGFGMAAWSLDSGLYASGAEGVLRRLADDGRSWINVGELQVPRFFHRLLPADRDSLYVVAGASLNQGHVGTIEKLEVGDEQ